MRRLIGLLLLVTACDEGAIRGGGEDDATSEAGARDVGLDMEPAVDLDAAAEDDALPDARLPGVFGDPCAEGGECESGYCVPGPDGRRVCSRRCADDCPDGWECSPVANTRPDTVFICVAQRRVQCLECEHDGDCGSGDDRCLEVGAGLYCLRACAIDDLCPEGHTCADVQVNPEDEEETARLCFPDEGACDPCQDSDGDGYGRGDECLGIDCNDQDDTVHAVAQLLSDGRDNDCDSETDEELPEGVKIGQFFTYFDLSMRSKFDNYELVFRVKLLGCAKCLV